MREYSGFRRYIQVNVWNGCFYCIYEEMLAVYNTDVREAMEWAASYVGWGNILLLFIGILGIYVFVHYLWLKVSHGYKDDNKQRNKYIVLAVVIEKR